MNNKSITRLTIYYILILMVISVAFSAIAYRIGSNELAYGLTLETNQISNQFPIFSGTQFSKINPNDLQIIRRHFFNEIIIVNIIVFILGSSLAYLLARSSLAPIEENLDKQKRFVSDVSHELRTPLTSIKMESEVALLNDQATKQELTKTLESVLEESGRLESLITNLLKISRLEQTDIAQSFSQVDLAEIINQAIAQMQYSLTSKVITLKTNIIDLTEPIEVLGDNELLTQLIVILLDNAIKYSKTNSQIDINLSANQYPEIKITDRGQGIPKTDLEHIFERFYRSDKARSGNQGFGLGLSIAKVISDLHQIEITIGSKVNYGTEVKLTFL